MIKLNDLVPPLFNLILINPENVQTLSEYNVSIKHKFKLHWEGH